jgi:hypothetical protein
MLSNNVEAGMPYALSGALRQLSECLADEMGLPKDEDGGESFRIRVASDREMRRRAYALAYRVYRGRGYAQNPRGLIVSDYDADPQTLTLLAEDEHGRDTATVSLVFDGSGGLPSDEIFGDEIAQLRSGGSWQTEITRLAISEEHQHSKILLLRLINFLFIFARRVKGADGCIIEVNPRHVAFYRRQLLFRQLSGERTCPRVCGAPAVLLHVPYAQVEEDVEFNRTSKTRSRTLYARFYPWPEEDAATHFLSENHRPMSPDDAHYFGLASVGRAGAQAW